MRLKKIFFLIFILLLLGSCGFHPRGVLSEGNAGNFSSLVDTTFYIQSDGYNSLVNELRRNLKSYRAKVITKSTESNKADYIINIQNVEKRSQLTSVVGGASNNTYLLIYTIEFNVVKPNNQTPVIPNSTINAQMFWQSNSGTQLAQNNQALRIYNYLQTGLVNRIVLQIAELLPSKEDKIKEQTVKK